MSVGQGSSVASDLAGTAAGYQTQRNEAHEQWVADKQRELDRLREMRQQRAMEQSTSWYNTLLDNVWMDDFQLGPFGRNNPVASAWQQGVGDKVNAVTTGVTTGYNAWNQAFSFGVAALPGGIAPFSWDQAASVSVGQAAAANMGKLWGQPLAQFTASLFGLSGDQATIDKFLNDTFGNSTLPNFAPSFDVTNEADRTALADSFVGGKLQAGVTDAVFTFFLDPLVIGGKAVKVIRFGSEAFSIGNGATSIAGLTQRQLTNSRVMKWFDAELDSAAANIADPTLPESSLNVMARTVARGNYDELRTSQWLEKNPFRDEISAVGSMIDSESDALIFLGAMGGSPKAIARFRETQHAAFDAFNRAVTIQNRQRAMLEANPSWVPKPILDDISNELVSAEMLLDDLTRRNDALRQALLLVDSNGGQPLLTNVGSKSVRYEKFKQAWNAGKAERSGKRANLALGEDDVAKYNPDSQTWVNRGTETDYIDVDKFLAEKRITAEEAARIRAVQERRMGTTSAIEERVFQESSWLRPVRVWSWVNSERASGYMDIRGIAVGSSTKELDAVLHDSKMIRNDLAFQLDMKNIWSAALRSNSPEERIRAVQNIEQAAFKYFGDAYGADEDAIKAIYKVLDDARFKTVNQFKGGRGNRAFGVDPFTEELIVADPRLSSQLESRMPMLDFAMLEKTAKLAARPEYRGLKRAQSAEVAKNLLDEVASLWKASVLLRLGYTQRNVVEGWLRTAAVLGTIPALGAAPRGLGRMVWSNRTYSKLGRFAPRRARMAAQIDDNQRAVASQLRALREQREIAQRQLFDYAQSRPGAVPPVALTSELERRAGEFVGRKVTKRTRFTAEERQWAYNDARDRLESAAQRTATWNNEAYVKPTQKAIKAEQQRILREEMTTTFEPGDPIAEARLLLQANAARTQSGNWVSTQARRPVVVTRAGKGRKGPAKDEFRPVAVWEPTPEAAAILRKSGQPIPKYMELPQNRADLFAERARAAGVEGYSTTDLRGMRMFLSTDRKTGFALDEGDNVVAVFGGDNIAVRRFAVEMGGRRSSELTDLVDNYAATFDNAIDPRMAELREKIKVARADEVKLADQYRSLAAERAKYGKRAMNMEGAFAGANGGLYRDMASARATTERVLESNLGREAQIALDNTSWVLVKPGQNQYWDELQRSVEQFRNDQLALMALEGKSRPEMLAWLSTDEGRAYASQMHLSKREWQGRVAQVHGMVYDYLPTEQARALAAQGARGAQSPIPSIDALKAMLDDPAIRLKPIHGREVQSRLQGAASVNEMIHRPINWLFNILGTVPETVAVRQPFYNEVWQRRVGDLTRMYRYRYGVKGPLPQSSVEAIEQNAHAYALKAVNDTLYTIQRYSSPAHALRFVAPFFPAWENSIKVWAGIVWRDPSVAARAAMLWQIPNKMGMIVDENGNKIESDPFAFGTGSINRYIMLPQALTDAFAKLSNAEIPFTDTKVKDLGDFGGVVRALGTDGFRVPQGSLNVVSPGQTPWLPGFGPLVVAPAGMILESKPNVQKFLRDVMGDALYQQIAPFGVASADPTDTVVPPAVRKFWQRWQGESNQEYLQTVDAMMRTAMIDWYKSGSRPEDKPDVDMIRQRANDFYLFSTVASLTLPFSIARTSKHQQYIDAWNNMKTGPGTYAEKVDAFLELYGEAYMPIITSSSGSLSRDIDPTIETYRMMDGNRGLVEQLATLGPETIGIIGATAPLGQFDQGVYEYWLHTDIPGQPGTRYKNTLSPTEMQEKIELSAAWREFNAAKAERDAALAARGGMSINAKVNADIAQQWAWFTDQFMVDKYGPAWSAAYNDYNKNSGKFLTGVAVVLNSDGFTGAGTPLWQQIREYMLARQDAQQAIRSGANSELVRDQFEAWASDYRFTSLEFADFFDNYLANDDLSIGVPYVV